MFQKRGETTISKLAWDKRDSQFTNNRYPAKPYDSWNFCATIV